MATARSTLRTRLKLRLANRDDLTSAQLDTYLNAGLLELATRLEIPDLRTRVTTSVLTVGVNTLTYPTAMIAIAHIWNTTKGWEIGKTEWPRIRGIKLVSGDPRLWAAWGKTIYFNKLSSTADALDIIGQVRPTWAAADASLPGIDDEYEYGLLLLAAAQAHRDIGEAEKADRIDDPLRGEFAVWSARNRFNIVAQESVPTRDTLTVQLSGYDGVS